LTPSVINRILIVLGFAGLFISGFLSLSHLMDISLPCGPAKGCDVVATHSSAYLVGDSVKGGFPVAYLGFLGYLFLTGLALFRSIRGSEASRPLAVLGFGASLLGAMYSGYLIYVSLNVIKATCIWCMASAVVMLITTVTAAALLQADPEKERKKTKLDIAIAGILTVVVAAGLVGGASYLKASGETLDGGLVVRIREKNVNLVGPDAHILGDPNAPVTLIEFADLLCPSCQDSFPVLHELVNSSKGKIRLVFHHFPLFMKPEHKMAVPAASIAEMAAEEGKFWVFITGIYSKKLEELQEPDALLAIAKSVGMDTAKIQERLKNPNDPAIERVTADMNMANEIKIKSTPTLFLQAQGREPEIVAASQLENRLNEEPYISLIRGGAAGQ
jgi:protein-disulfide isomerase